ncbi:MAG: ribosomal protein S6--L-glutamate ligase [bacterium]|jgi:ribosomal protein S6--L-glutamate ligase
MTKKMVLGSEEWCSLPSLGLEAVKARIDSGATTSSLHAYNQEVIKEDGKEYVLFDVHPIVNNRSIHRRCKALLLEQRMIKSSNGHKDLRYVVQTILELDEQTWQIELTLTNRDSMGFRMLLGREAMDGRIMVDPEGKCLLKNYTKEQILKVYKKHTVEKSGLKIVLLASNPNLYSNKRIMEAGESRGHEMIFVNVRQTYMHINARRPAIHYLDGTDITDVDAVIPRLKPSITFYGCSVTRQFEASGVLCLNTAEAITCSRDKLKALQILSSKGIDMPSTGFANSPQNTKDLINIVGGAPLVIKLLEGTQGRGVILAETAKASENLINGFKSLNANFLVQEFIKESSVVDLRCFVIGGRVVAAMERRSTDGDFRANIHLGAQALEAKLTKDEKKMAIAATKILGLDVAGVDILRSNSGPKILEVNSSPGLEGIERASGKDIASLMIDDIEKNFGNILAKKNKKKAKLA